MDIRTLLNQIASAEGQLHTSPFLMPCVKGGKGWTRVAGMVYRQTSQPHRFEGWGLFQSIDQQTATLIAEAALPDIA